MDYNWSKLVNQLRGAEYHCGVVHEESVAHLVEFEVGLSDAEIFHVERRFRFRFPPDLRAFLHEAMPSGPSFPDWRSGDEKELRHWLDEPRQGVLFDVEHNDFWLMEWGERAESQDAVLEVASKFVAEAPQLIPIYGHRVIPVEPSISGNPIFSVHQTDIIYYGFDLMDYFRNEFNPSGRAPWPKTLRTIRFWDIDRFTELS